MQTGNEEELAEQNQWKHYTVGFCFNKELTKVLLIRKVKPVWQAGRLNGIGGSFEPEDKNDSINCMSREFVEETGFSPHFKVDQITWRKFAEGEITCHQGNCFLHYMVGVANYFKPHITNNEECVWVDCYDLPIDAIPNLHWLVPMARIALTKLWWSEIATFRTLI